MKLLVIRHCVAVDRDSWEGPEALRPLTADGEKAAAALGRFLARTLPRPEVILSSPSARAIATAAILTSAAGWELPEREDPRLSPGFDLGEFRELLAEFPRAETAVIVGHEPDLSRLVRRIIGGGECKLRKGGLACVDLRDREAPLGRLLWLLPPDILGLGPAG